MYPADITIYFDIQTQFLCCVPIKKIQWNNVLNDLSWDDQKRLLDDTVNLTKLRKFPIDPNYIVRFLRFIIDALEHQCVDVHDDLYTTLCTYQSQSNDCTEYSYKHYQIFVEENNSIESISLKENRNKISQGTTGLNVWESALAISDWAIANKHLFRDKHVLELGAGTGLSSLIITKCCSPASVHISDGNDKVIENLLENVTNNFEKLENDQYLYHDGKTTIDVVNLNWTETSVDHIRTTLKDIDLIIAADVIYDDTLFNSLLSTVRLLFDNCDRCDKLVLVNAVRNPDTESAFLTMLGEFGLQYQEEPTITPKLLYWEPNQFSPIKLYTISNADKK